MGSAPGGAHGAAVTPRVGSLVLQDDVGQPDHGGGHPQQLDVVVVLGVPPQAVIGPLLGKGSKEKGGVTALPGAACPVLSPKRARQGTPTKGGVGYGASPPRGEKVTEGGVLSEVSPSRSRRWW